MPPFDSMPHATGRRAPRGQTKIDLNDVAEIRKLAYIPTQVSNASLRTEHPNSYNSPMKIFSKLGKSIVSMGDMRILAYIGKI